MEPIVLTSRSILLACVLFSFFLPSFSQPPPDEKKKDFDFSGWMLVFNDEFNGDSVDLGQWRLRTPWGDPQIPSYNLPENVYLKDGNLRLRVQKLADRQNFPVPWHGNNPQVQKELEYTSASVWGKQAFHHGYFEARIRVPKGRGFVPAFWLFRMCTSCSGVKDEIDIFEFKGEATHEYDATLKHPNNICRFRSSPDPDRHTKKIKQKHTRGDVSNEFHIYSVEWNGERIIWYFDRKPVYNLKCTVNHWMNIIFTLPINDNTQPGLFPGNLTGPPDDNTLFPGYMDIDYIRVYKNSGCENDETICNYMQDWFTPSTYAGKTIVVGGNNCFNTLHDQEFLNLVATDYVNLKPGLHIRSGSRFHAWIDDRCEKSKASEKVIDLGDSLEIKVFPNPSTGKYTIDLPESYEEWQEGKVVSLSGQVIQKISPPQSQRFEIDFTHIPAGVYVLFIRTQKRGYYVKLFKI